MNRCSLKIQVLSLLAVLIALSCDITKHKKVERENDSLTKQETYSIFFEVKDYEAKKLDIYAQKAEYSGDTTIIYDFRANFYDQDSVIATMIGDTGKVQEYSGFMEVKGKVKLISTTGDSLLSGKLIWNKRLNLIYSPDESILYKEGKVIRSSGLEADPQLTKITFKGKVYVE